MKFKLLNQWILRALFLAFLSPSLLTAKDVVEIDVCYINKMNPPYVLNPNVLDNGYPGITIDFLRLVEIESGVKFNFITQPWHQCLEDLKSNRINATFHASYTKERSEYGEYPSNNGELDKDRHLLTQTYYIYKHKDFPLSWDGKVFNNLSKPVSAMTRFSVVKDLKKMGITVEETTDVVLNLKKVISGEVAAFINYASQTDAALENNKEIAKTIEKVNIPFSVKTKYLLFSKDFYQNNEETVEAVWNAFERLRKEGRFSEIEANYILTEFSYLSPYE